MTDAERNALGLTKKLTYRYTFASGDFNFLEKHKNTNYLRALARLGIYNDSGESFNEKYFTPDSIEQVKKKKDGVPGIKLEKPIYISDFVAPLEKKKTKITPGGITTDQYGNEIDPPIDLIEEEIIREAESKLTPPGVQLGLEGANQQQGGGGSTGGTGGTAGQPAGVVINADDEEAAANNDASGTGGTGGTGGTSVSDSSSIREKLNRLLGYKIVNGSVEVDRKGKKIMLLDKPPLSVSAGVEPKIEDDGSISVDGNVTINIDLKANKGINIIENGKLTIKFSNVKGNFICRGRKLTSLEGCPKTVGGTFDCGDNQLTSLNGAPQEVGIFIADKNKSLTSLAGGPKIINGITDTAKSQNVVIYDVSNCGLTTLENNGITKFGPGGFSCALNKLTSLTGLGIVASTGVVSFDCSKNELTSLNGIPRPIKDAKSGRPGNYWIRDNVGVTLFPVTMADFEVDQFIASGLSLSSLSFAPKQVYGNFDCSNNKGAKKLTNQSIGKDRFKVGGGFEEDSGNRIVKIDGEFITSEGTWKDKTYDANTVFKKSEIEGGAGGGVLSTTSGGVVTYKYGNGTIHLTLINNFSIGFGKITPVVNSSGQQVRGSNKGTGFKYHFEGFTPKVGKPAIPADYMGPNDYDGKIGSMRFEVWPDKYKNFINWGTWEAASTGWGTLQPTCAFIYNGKNYGAMTKTCGNISVAITGGQPSLVYNSRYWDRATETIKANAPRDLLMAGGSSTVVENGQVQTASFSKDARGWPFIGQAKLKDGKTTWFAGASVSGHSGNELGQALVAYFNSIGGSVIIAAHGDGGGSTAFVVNRKAYTSGNRQVSVILYW
jgi:hypothetical protein